MPTTSVRCPNSECSARYKVDALLVGKKAKCKKCGRSFKIAEVPAAQASTPEQASAAMEARKERARGDDGILLIWEPGDVILDLYEVIKLPGTQHGYAEGGMGRVNLVHHRAWNRDLAVKSVLPAKSASPRDIEIFKTEAEQWVDRIGMHPNIVACDYVRVLGGVPRVFIEYVDGGSLQHWIDSRRLYEGGPQAALERILDVAIQTGWGLHYVHELGLVHQDVKPLNVMMTTDGVAKVTDFGLVGARAAAFEGNEEPPAGKTILASWGGMTPAYCSPEQAEISAKRKAGVSREQLPKLTRRTDIWSWAVSVLHMFLGKITWPAGQVAHVGLQREAEQRHLPPMPPAVKELLRICFQKQPDDRPHDMIQMADPLLTIYQQVTGQPYPRETPKPDNLLADSCNNRGVSLFDLGKTAEAEQKWQDALRVDPHHPEAAYNWGLIQWRSGRLTDQRLLESLREVRATSSDAARVDYLVGLVHVERTDGQAAVQVLSEAATAGTRYGEITAALALANSMGSPSGPLRRTFEGHTESVKSVSWSPDGRFVLSGSLDTTLRLWEVSSGQCLRTFEGHTSGVQSVSWGPEGRYILSGSYDKTLRLWEVSSGWCLRAFEGHTAAVNSVSWSPDSRYALSASEDKRLRLWEVSSGRCLRAFEGHTAAVNSVSWSPDGRYALSGSDDEQVVTGDANMRLWEVSTGRCLDTYFFEGHWQRVFSVSWSPDGRYALSGGSDKTMRLWNVLSGKHLRTFEVDGWVNSVSWSPDGRYALSGSGWLRLWDVFSGQCLCTFKVNTNTVDSVSSSDAVSWSPDGRFAVSGGYDKTLRLWAIAFAKQPVPLVASMAFAANSAVYRRLIQLARDAVTGDPAVAAGYLQQARQQPGCSQREDALEQARALSHCLAHRGFVGGWEKRTFHDEQNAFVHSASWSPDARYVLEASSDNRLRLWDVFSGGCLRIFEGHTEWLNSVSWSPDSLYALSGSRDNTLRLWEVSSGKCLRIFEGHTSDVNSVSLSPDGLYALSGSEDGTVRLWEVSSGQCLRTLEGHTSGVESVSWRPDGGYVLSASEDGTVRLWEVSSGKCLRTLEGHQDVVKSVSWSPDSRNALSGSCDETLRLWEVSSGKCLRVLEGHASWVNSVSWSPDGRYALSAGSDRTLRLWDVLSGECLRIFEGHARWVNSVSWSPNGRFALSASEDATVRLWELDWEFEANQPADWDEGARSFLSAFLTVHTPYADGLFRRGKPSWTDEDFRRLLDQLGCGGYGWLRPEGVRRELEKMAADWQGPPALV